MIKPKIRAAAVLAVAALTAVPATAAADAKLLSVDTAEASSWSRTGRC